MSQTLHAAFRAQARLRPDAVAVSGDSGLLTYAELDHRSDRLAQRLAGSGVGPGVLVAVHLGRTLELLVAILGVLKAGAGYVPIDSGTPVQRIAFIVAEIGSPVVLTQTRLAAGIAGLGVELLCLDEPEPDAAAPVEAPDDRATAAATAYVMYTSGTTGKPNGVVVAHGPLMNYLRWAADYYDLRSGAGALVHSPIGFDLTVTTLLGPLLVGQRVILVEPETGVRALAAALSEMDDITIVKLTPTHLKVLGLMLTPAEVAGRVRTLVVGGEDLWAPALELFRGPGGPRIVNEYGPTETVVGCCIYEVAPSDPATGRVPIGRPIANTAIDVVDADLRPVPPGSTGEALIRGAGVTDGYLHRPEVSAARFVDRPSGRAYRTGDLVRLLPSGELEYLGRNDEQVKIRGVRVELGEIAGVLKNHPAVAEAAVTVQVQVSSAPIDDVRALAFVILEPGVVVDPAELAGHCRSQLPEFLVPEAIHVVDSLPTTPNGKLDRAALVSGRT